MGACNKFVVVILGGILFKAKITPVGWMSVFIGVVAGVVFAIAKARPVEQPGGGTEKPRAEAVVSFSDIEDDDEDSGLTRAPLLSGMTASGDEERSTRSEIRSRR